MTLEEIAAIPGRIWSVDGAAISEPILIIYGKQPKSMALYLSEPSRDWEIGSFHLVSVTDGTGMLLASAETVWIDDGRLAPLSLRSGDWLDWEASLRSLRRKEIPSWN